MTLLQMGHGVSGEVGVFAVRHAVVTDGERESGSATVLSHNATDSSASAPLLKTSTATSRPTVRVVSISNTQAFVFDCSTRFQYRGRMESVELLVYMHWSHRRSQTSIPQNMHESDAQQHAIDVPGRQGTHQRMRLPRRRPLVITDYRISSIN